VRLLEEDGTTIVFPRVLRQLSSEMKEIARRLGEQSVGPITTMTQEDVRSTLAELLESLKKLREKMQQQKQQQGGAPAGGGSGAPVLVPTSEELKLLRTSQARINQQTDVANEARETGEEDAGEITALLDRAAGKQAELIEMAREMQQRAEKGN
jgi:hypothetical protein